MSVNIPARTYGPGTYVFGPFKAAPGSYGAGYTIAPATRDLSPAKRLDVVIEQSRDGGASWSERLRVGGPLTTDPGLGLQTFFSDAQPQDAAALFRVTVTLAGGDVTMPIALDDTFDRGGATTSGPAMNPFTYIAATAGTASSASATTLTYTPASGYTGGNLVVSVVGWATTTTVTSGWTMASNSNPSATIGVGTGSAQRVEARYVQNITGGTLGTTVTFAAATAYTIHCNEFSGAATTGAYQGGGAYGTGTGTTGTAGSYTPGSAPVLLFAFQNLAGNPTAQAAGVDGQGHAMSFGTGNTTSRNATEYLEEASTAAYAPTFTWTGSLNFATGVIAFNPAAATGGPPERTLTGVGA